MDNYIMGAFAVIIFLMVTLLEKVIRLERRVKTLEEEN